MLQGGARTRCCHSRRRRRPSRGRGTAALASPAAQIPAAAPPGSPPAAPPPVPPCRGRLAKPHKTDVAYRGTHQWQRMHMCDIHIMLW